MNDFSQLSAEFWDVFKKQVIEINTNHDTLSLHSPLNSKDLGYPRSLRQKYRLKSTTQLRCKLRIATSVFTI